MAVHPSPQQSGPDGVAQIQSPFLSVLIPVLNEAATLDAVVDAVLAVDVDLELIMVDDGSTDGTWARMLHRSRDPRVQAVRHPANRGKGAALRTALSHATGSYVIVQDADLEYDPADYLKLLEPVRAGRATVVYGTRPFSSHSSFSFWYVMGNKMVTLAANVLYNRYLHDIETCYKLLPRQMALALDLRGHGFEIDPEITAKVLRLGHRIYEVPITYVARTREEGKKIVALDGVKALGVLVRYRRWKAPAGAELSPPRRQGPATNLPAFDIDLAADGEVSTPTAKHL